jgi:3'-5' exoribonuclease
MQLFPEPDAPPRVLRLSNLPPGQQADCFVLLVALDRGSTRDGKPYFRATFRDNRRSATAMIWHDGAFYADCEQAWKPGRFYKVRGKYVENQYGPQLELDKIREVTPSDERDGFDEGDFVDCSRFDPEQMHAELTGLVEAHVEDAALQRLVLELLAEHAEAIKTFPAARKNHHAYRSGYLEHVLSVTKTAVFLADKYRAYYDQMQPPLNKSLVVAGAALHDIGKVLELDAQPQGAVYTAQGQLIGHILLGRDLVREKAAQLGDLDAETLLRLEHIIVSHQNLPEWGSPIAPHTPEALLVHYADEIDAKFHMLATALETEPAGDEEFTPRDNALRRPVFRSLRNSSGR